MRLHLLRTAIVLIVLIFATQSAYAEKRVALVVGNDKYDTLRGLNNAQADVMGIACWLAFLTLIVAFYVAQAFPAAAVTRGLSVEYMGAIKVLRGRALMPMVKC